MVCAGADGVRPSAGIGSCVGPFSVTTPAGYQRTCDDAPSAPAVFPRPPVAAALAFAAPWPSARRMALPSHASRDVGAPGADEGRMAHPDKTHMARDVPRTSEP